jgi:hypothetical protein
MRRIYAKHEPYTDGHIGKVADDMELCGEPTIRCVEFKNDLFAIEGSHRLYLAHRNNLIPKIILLEPDLEGLGEEYYLNLKATLPFYDFEYVLKIGRKEVFGRNKMKIMCETGEIKEAYINGYHFGDRLLEDVLFRITIENNKIICDDVSELSKPYLNDFVKEQQKVWFKNAIEYVEWSGDLLQTLSGNNAWIETEENNV